MSHVTNVILTSFLEHEEYLEQVNQFFKLETGLVDVESGMKYGGSKVLEMDIAIGAFNYFDLDLFVAHLKTIPWEDPHRVQLMVCCCDENDEVFRLVTVFE